MRQVLFALAGLAAAAVALPAAAQSADDIHQRLRALEQQVQRSGGDGEREFRRLVSLDAQYRQNGLTTAEAQDLRGKIAALDSRIANRGEVDVLGPPYDAKRDAHIWTSYDGRYEDEPDRSAWASRYSEEDKRRKELEAFDAAFAARGR